LTITILVEIGKKFLEWEFEKFIGVDFRISNLWTGGAVHKFFLN